MEKITLYRTNGKIFENYEDANNYERLCKKVNGIMSQLLPRTEGVEKGIDFNKHNKETLNGCLKAFCKACAECIPSFKDWFIEVINGDRHISHMGRILGDCNSDYPILYDAYYRFSCIDFETGFEFQKPYYVIHQDEFFNGLKGC